MSRTLATTAIPQSASAGVALAGAALAEAALAEAALASMAVSDVGLVSIVDSDPAPSPSIGVSDLALASTVDSVAGLASVDLVVHGRLTPTGLPLDSPQVRGKSALRVGLEALGIARIGLFEPGRRRCRVRPWYGGTWFPVRQAAERPTDGWDGCGPDARRRVRQALVNHLDAFIPGVESSEAEWSGSGSGIGP